MGNLSSGGTSECGNTRALRLRLYQAILENDCSEVTEILDLISPNFVYRYDIPYQYCVKVVSISCQYHVNVMSNQSR